MSLLGTGSGAVAVPPHLAGRSPSRRSSASGSQQIQLQQRSPYQRQRKARSASSVSVSSQSSLSSGFGLEEDAELRNVLLDLQQVIALQQTAIPTLERTIVRSCEHLYKVHLILGFAVLVSETLLFEGDASLISRLGVMIICMIALFQTSSLQHEQQMIDRQRQDSHEEMNDAMLPKAFLRRAAEELHSELAASAATTEAHATGQTQHLHLSRSATAPSSHSVWRSPILNTPSIAGKEDGAFEKADISNSSFNNKIISGKALERKRPASTNSRNTNADYLSYDESKHQSQHHTTGKIHPPLRHAVSSPAITVAHDNVHIIDPEPLCEIGDDSSTSEAPLNLHNAKVKVIASPCDISNVSILSDSLAYQSEASPLGRGPKRELSCVFVDGAVVHNENEARAVQKLRSRLWDIEANLDSLALNMRDTTLIRFLRARKLNVDAAEKMLRDAHDWRQNNCPEKVFCRMEQNPWPEPLEYSTGGWSGVDREGAPVFIDRIGQLDVSGMLARIEPKHFEDFCIWRLETNQRLMREAERRTGQAQYQLCVIEDLKGLGWQHFNRSAFKLVQIAAQVNDLYYPEQLKVCYIVNAPKLFSAIWNVVQRFFDPVTREKIQIFSNCPTEVLCKRIHPDSLPAFLGGNYTSGDGDVYCMDEILPGGKIPSHVPSVRQS